MDYKVFNTLGAGVFLKFSNFQSVMLLFLQELENNICDIIKVWSLIYLLKKKLVQSDDFYGIYGRLKQGCKCDALKSGIIVVKKLADIQNTKAQITQKYLSKFTSLIYFLNPKKMAFYVVKKLLWCI